MNGTGSPAETGLVFRETAPDYAHDWHNAPQRQYILMLDGSVDVTVSSGETRRLSTGDILLCEDTTGRGHVSRAVNGQPRRSVFVTLE
ncbi:cupin domain-containing protein [Kushneria indalinina]|nr:cupin domain-containing protein [Kushneria indalinina]